MIDSEGIYRKANELVQNCGTRDTIKLARMSGIDVIATSNFQDLLGMYAYRWKHRVIFYNDRMDDYLTQIVVGHEVGHDTYHRELAKGRGLQEFELFRIKSSTEYEANAFAAHLLIDTNECLEYARNGYDVTQIARSMYSEINLMLIKLQELSRLGFNFRLPSSPKRDFFKNIRADNERFI